jgi:hypothetical protein
VKLPNWKAALPPWNNNFYPPANDLDRHQRTHPTPAMAAITTASLSRKLTRLEAAAQNRTTTDATVEAPLWEPRPTNIPQGRAYDSPADILGYGGAAGGGKRLSVDTPIATPRGWTTMGDLRAGDQIFDEAGHDCNVVHAFPAEMSQAAFAVEFSDGSIIEADAEHLWRTCTSHESAGAVRTTAEIAATLYDERRLNHLIAVGSTLDLPDRYIVGVRPISPRLMRCIAVDSPSHLYLAGRQLIPTHNSDLLLGLAVTRHQRSLILRRESSKPLRALIDRAREILGDRGSLNENTGVWRGLPGGRQIEFGGCKDAGDEQAYRGRPHDLIGIDEADQFLEMQVRFLLGWLRTTDPRQRCRVVLAFNPPSTATGRWLLRFFGPWLDPTHPRPAKPGELRWYATLPRGAEIERPDGEAFVHAGSTIRPLSRTFIPARVTDNPDLMATGYLAQLQGLPEPLRSQLLEGDFRAGVQDDPWQVIPTAWVEAAQKRWERHRLIKEGPPDGARLEALGVDVARGGRDQTVIAKRYGSWFDVKAFPGKRTPDGESVALLVKQELTDNALVNIDAIGIGASPVDACRRLLRGARIFPIISSNPVQATDRTGLLRFVNVRAYLYWSMREALDPANKRNVALPPSRELLADLTAPTWSKTATGIKVEPKADIVKRIGRSPDLADACVYALALPAGP